MKTLGRAIRARRTRLGLSLNDAAGLCNVGSRFLTDLESGKATVQFDLAVGVAERLGVRIAFVAPDVVSVEPFEFASASVKMSRPSEGEHWAIVSQAGSQSIRHLGLVWESTEVDRASSELTLSTSLPVVRPFFGKKIERSAERGYEVLLEFIDSHSYAPAMDRKKVVSLAVATTLLGDTAFSIEGLCFGREADGAIHFTGIAGVQPATVLFGGLPQGGFVIAGEWPSEWLRADHFTSFASMVDVKPRMVFEVMSDLAENLPAQFERALQQQYRSTVLRGKAADALRLVQGRALRMKELITLASGNGVAGVKTTRKIFIEKPAKKEDSYSGHETLYE